MSLLKHAAMALVLAASVPAFAQAGPGDDLRPRAAMFAGMSEVGRQTILGAMGGLDARADRARIQSARDRMLEILDSDRLDVPALRRAMEEERGAVSTQQARRQGAMLTAFQQLSPADRKAFVVGARSVRSRIEQRAAAGRDRRMQRMGAAAGAMPPPR